MDTLLLTMIIIFFKEISVLYHLLFPGPDLLLPILSLSLSLSHLDLGAEKVRILFHLSLSTLYKLTIRGFMFRNELLCISLNLPAV